MAKKLFRLAMSATTLTAPTVSRYFYSATAAVSQTAAYSILRSKFVKDNGSAVTSVGLVTAIANNGYYLLFVNGELQQSSIFTVTGGNTGGVTLLSGLSGGITIPLSGVVTLAVTNFAPTTSVRS